MSEEIIIKINNLSKSYRLGVYTADTIVEDFRIWWNKKSRNRNNFTENHDTGRIDKKGIFWALKNINLEVSRGEILGIIGKNGAGKSTLLKILSRVTTPTTGEVKIRGRVASLLEVGTGFHPELTGRENIFLNGAILGMNKKEINTKLDEIIDFSGVYDHIDTPVKRYSSGMKVRLGFAVAAHLEPEILVVDEVLAVGDAEFQKKCLGKMKDVSKSGRTILFVSHNTTAIRSLCTKAVLLADGMVEFNGSTDETISRYLGGNYSERNDIIWSENEYKNSEIDLKRIHVISGNKEKSSLITMEDPLRIQIVYERLAIINRIDFTLHVKGLSGDILFTTSTTNVEEDARTGFNIAIVELPGSFFNSGVIEVNLLVIKNRREIMFQIESALSFTIVDSKRSEGHWMGRSKGDLAPDFNWTISSKV